RRPGHGDRARPRRQPGQQRGERTAQSALPPERGDHRCLRLCRRRLLPAAEPTRPPGAGAVAEAVAHRPRGRRRRRGADHRQDLRPARRLRLGADPRRRVVVDDARPGRLHRHLRRLLRAAAAGAAVRPAAGGPRRLAARPRDGRDHRDRGARRAQHAGAGGRQHLPIPAPPRRPRLPPLLRTRQPRPRRLLRRRPRLEPDLALHRPDRNLARRPAALPGPDLLHGAGPLDDPGDLRDATRRSRAHRCRRSGRAGIPATVSPAGTSRLTTAPEATTAPRPTVIPGSSEAPAPIAASSSIVGGSNPRTSPKELSLVVATMVETKTRLPIVISPVRWDLSITRVSSPTVTPASRVTPRPSAVRAPIRDCSRIEAPSPSRTSAPTSTS